MMRMGALSWTRLESSLFCFLFQLSTTLYSVLGFTIFLWAFFGNGSESENCFMSESFLFGNLVWAWLGTGLGLAYGYDWKGFLK